MKRTVDLSGEQDMDRLAAHAISIAEKLRDEDTNRLFDELMNLAQWHPAKTAQLVLCLAAWFDPNVTTRTLWTRVEAITEDRTQAGRVPLDWAACGTERQAARHRRRGEAPCAKCRAAETRARAARGYRKRVAA